MVAKLSSAQRRPGRRPRRHLPSNKEDNFLTSALNEGRGVDPGDTRCRTRWSCTSRSSLNEGRDVDPGASVCGTSAQRRPGRRPRRLCATVVIASAQRRPGRRPRRHIRAGRTTLNEGRG